MAVWSIGRLASL